MTSKPKPTFEYLIIKLQHEIEEYYGVKDALTRIDFSHEAFNILMTSMLEPTSYYKYSLSNFNDFKIYGVKINARERSKDD